MSTTSLACWMAKLPSDMAARPLCLLKIPGSHDSGATCVLNERLPVANDQSTYIRNLGKAKCVRRGVKRWAITQSYSIREQLDLGIRYFDLRISFPTSDIRISDKDFRLVHSLYGPSIQEVLQQVAEFLAKNTKEVVFLDMNHLFNMDELTYRKLQNETTTILGRNQICPFMNSNMVSLDFMWSNGYRVIVFTSFIETNPTIFWPATTICSPWPNTNKINNLLDILSFNLEHRQDDTFKFFVTQGVCTPRVSDVIRRWFSTLRTTFSLRTTERVLKWLDTLSEKQHKNVNIVILDFIEIESSCKIVSLN